MSLLKRRFATFYADNNDSLAKVLVLEDLALSYNAEAIEYAALASDLTQLSNYAANRTLILSEILRRQSERKTKAVKVADWSHSLQWLALSHEISMSARVAGDSLWSPIYLLVTYRFVNDESVWHHVLQDAAKICVWFKNRENEHVVTTALAMAQPTLSQVLQQSKSERVGFARQLITLGAELAKSGQNTYQFPFQNPLIQSLYTAVMAIPKNSSEQIARFEESKAAFATWMKQD